MDYPRTSSGTHREAIRLRGLNPDKATFDGLIAQLEPKLDVYEQILSKQKYLAGDELTLADLFHLPYGVLLSTAGSNAIEVRPNVARLVLSSTNVFPCVLSSA